MKTAALTAAALAIYMVTGCAAVSDTVSDTKSKMTSKMTGGDPIADAIAAYEEASKAGCAWRDTDNMIVDAQKLKDAGKTEESNALAEKALHQSQIGMEQCASEKKRYSAGV